jgi:thiamine biosynthesis lipoprotein
MAVAREAMATRFEIVLPGSDEIRLRAAAEAALDEIDRLEAQLSFYRSDSELTRVNRLAAACAVQVEPQFFGLLERAKRIHELTAGAFDPTIAPLLRAWGFVGSCGHLPDPAEIEKARAVTGMHLVRLDREARTVRFETAGVRLDLGGIGKGYAIERAAEMLLDLGITSGMIHGGTSTAYALGAPPGGDGWMIAIPQPMTSGIRTERDALDDPKRPLTVVSLRDAAMSVSAVWGKAFESNGQLFGHVLDPRTGSPVAGATMAAVVTGSATDADAYSTALLVLGGEGLDLLANAEGVRGQLVVEPGSVADRPRISTRGIACPDPQSLGETTGN